MDDSSLTGATLLREWEYVNPNGDKSINSQSSVVETMGALAS